MGSEHATVESVCESERTLCFIDAVTLPSEVLEEWSPSEVRRWCVRHARHDACRKVLCTVWTILSTVPTVGQHRHGTSHDPSGATVK